MTSAEDLADMLDGRSQPRDAESRAMASIAARIGSLPVRSEPVAGWAALDARFDAMVSGRGSRRWFEGWLGPGRPRPLVQRLAAGALFISAIGGASGAATGTTPVEAAQAFGDGVSGFVRYVTFRGDNGAPGGLTVDATATSTPTVTSNTPSPLTTNTPATTTPAGSTPVATRTSTVAAQDIRTYAVLDAGSVVLRVEGGALVLVSTSPAAGWSATGDQSDDANEVEVVFTSGGREVEFSAELEDGVVTTEVKDDSSDDDSGDDE